MAKVKKAAIPVLIVLLVLFLLCLSFKLYADWQVKERIPGKADRWPADIPAETLTAGPIFETSLSGTSLAGTAFGENQAYCAKRILVHDGKLYYIVHQNLIACTATAIYRYDEGTASGTAVRSFLQEGTFAGIWDHSPLVQVADLGVFSPKAAIYGYSYQYMDPESQRWNALPESLTSILQGTGSGKLFIYPLDSALAIVVRDRLYLAAPDETGEYRISKCFRNIQKWTCAYQGALIVQSGQWYILYAADGRLRACELPDYVAEESRILCFLENVKRLYYCGKMEKSNGIHGYDPEHPEDSWLLLIDDPEFHYMRCVVSGDEERYVYYMASASYNQFDFGHTVLRRYDKAEKTVDASFRIPVELPKGTVDSAVVFHGCLFYTTEGGTDDARLYRTAIAP